MDPLDATVPTREEDFTLHGQSSAKSSTVDAAGHDMFEPLPLDAVDDEKNSFSFGSLFNSLSKSWGGRHKSKSSAGATGATSAVPVPDLKGHSLEMPPEHDPTLALEQRRRELEGAAPGARPGTTASSQTTTASTTSARSAKASKRRPDDRRARKSVHDRDRRMHINSLFGRLKGVLGISKQAGRQDVLREAVTQLEAQTGAQYESEPSGDGAMADGAAALGYDGVAR